MSDPMPKPPKPGDRVRCRTAAGDWVPMIARSEPRYDRGNCLGRQTFLTVAVSVPGSEGSVNWPAEDVRIDYTPAGATDE